ncbi:transposase, partial [Roseinatronobacter alkalisoli]
MRRLGVGVGDDTVLRQLKQVADNTAPPPRVIGIDDWSWKKSQTYGTIIVDLERHVVIDILEDRTVQNLRQAIEEQMNMHGRATG